ncbi:MAG: rod shape-determining protein MreC, partial [Candidatus Omnitrophota bacterium]
MRIYRVRRFPAKLVFLILIIGIVVFKPSLAHKIKTITFEILAVPFKAVSEMTGYFGRAKNISAENLLLKQRLADFSVTLARMEEIAKENDRLAALLEFRKNLPYKTTIAKVIARDPSDWRWAVTINKGKNHGIKEHMPCVTSKGVVGSVTEVGPWSSKVTLITDPNSRIGVMLESTRESGLLVGTSEETCRIIYLSLDGSVKPGDKVLTAGFSSFFPKGLPIGEIKKVGIEKTQ